MIGERRCANDHFGERFFNGRLAERRDRGRRDTALAPERVAGALDAKSVVRRAFAGPQGGARPVQQIEAVELEGGADDAGGVEVDDVEPAGGLAGLGADGVRDAGDVGSGVQVRVSGPETQKRRGVQAV